MSTPPVISAPHAPRPVSLSRTLGKLGCLLLSLSPAVWLFAGGHTQPEVIVAALIFAAITSLACGFIIFKGAFKATWLYILCSVVFSFCLFGLNLVVGLFLGCVYLLGNK